MTDPGRLRNREMHTPHEEHEQQDTRASSLRGSTVGLPCQVMLLVTMTGLFMAAWSQDQTEPASRAPVSVTHRQQEPEAIDEFAQSDRECVEAETSAFAEPWSPVERDVDALTLAAAQADDVATEPRLPVIPVSQSPSGVLLADAPDELPVDALSLFDGCSMNLPHDIALGEYRLVNNVGLVQSIRITLDDLVYHGLPTDSPSRDMYTVVGGDQRWYFIRVDSAAAPAPVPLVAEKSEPEETLARELVCRGIESLLIARVYVRDAARDVRTGRWRSSVANLARQMADATRLIVVAAVDSLHPQKWADRISDATAERPEL